MKDHTSLKLSHSPRELHLRGTLMKKRIREKLKITGNVFHKNWRKQCEITYLNQRNGKHDNLTSEQKKKQFAMLLVAEEY